MKQNRNKLPLLMLAPMLACAGHPEHWQRAQLPHAEETTLASVHTGHRHRIQTSVIGEAPAQGYPVLYILDGDSYFPHAHLLAHTLLNPPGSDKSGALLIVGIGYPNQHFLDLEKRALDLTPPPREPDPRHGGAERFIRFLDDELAPLLHTRYRIDRSQQNLFGHSYGGLFATYHLYTRPQPYRRYFISSPSIWWDERRIDAYRQASQADPDKLDIHITVGEHEQAPEHDARRKARAMVENARALAAELSPRHHVTFAILDGETHGSAAYRALHHMLHTLKNTGEL